MVLLQAVVSLMILVRVGSSSSLHISTGITVASQTLSVTLKELNNITFTNRSVYVIWDSASININKKTLQRFYIDFCFSPCF